MRFATLPALSTAPDGNVVVVSADGTRCAPPSQVAPISLRSILERWEELAPSLESTAQELNTHTSSGTPLAIASCLAPLPRTFAFLDGSAFLEHVILARRARGAEPPNDLESIPLMYQGASDNFLPPRAVLPCGESSWGLDFEGEICVVTDEVPRGISAHDASAHIKLILLMNDITYRGLVPREVGTGFGFIQSKPPSSFAPFAVTPDELGAYWRDDRVQLPLTITRNGSWFGSPDCGEMHFSFGELIAHAARTRPLSAGTIIGSGTVSNRDHTRGQCCIAERRALETIHEGTPHTPWLSAGESIALEITLENRSVFGRIEHSVI